MNATTRCGRRAVAAAAAMTIASFFTMKTAAAGETYEKQRQQSSTTESSTTAVCDGKSVNAVMEAFGAGQLDLAIELHDKSLEACENDAQKLKQLWTLLDAYRTRWALTKSEGSMEMINATLIEVSLLVAKKPPEQRAKYAALYEDIAKWFKNVACKYDRALTYVNIALKLGGLSQRRYEIIAEIYADMGELEKAVEHYTKALEQCKDEKEKERIRQKIDSLTRPRENKSSDDGKPHEPKERPLQKPNTAEDIWLG